MTTVYVKKDCKKCKAALMVLRLNEVDFEVKDADQYQYEMREIMGAEKIDCPLIVDNGGVLNGYDPQKLVVFLNNIQ